MAARYIKLYYMIIYQYCYIENSASFISIFYSICLFQFSYIKFNITFGKKFVDSFGNKFLRFSNLPINKKFTIIQLSFQTLLDLYLPRILLLYN